MRNVLLDTECYHTLNFEFRGRRLSKIVELADAGLISLFTTTVTNEEVRKHLREYAEKIHETFVKFSRMTRLLPGDYVKLSEEMWSTEKLAEALLQEFLEFLENATVHELPCADLDLGPILQDYFMVKPPFGAGPKRKEFPDAIFIAAANRWAKEAGQPIYIISHDQDIISACKASPRLHSVESVGAFLDLLASDNETVAEFVRGNLRNRFDVIEYAAERLFQDCQFSASRDSAHASLAQVKKISLDESIEVVGPIAKNAERVEATISVEIDYIAEVDYLEYKGYHEEPDLVSRRAQNTCCTEIFVTAKIKGLDSGAFEIESIDLGTHTVVVDYW